MSCTYNTIFQPRTNFIQSPFSAVCEFITEPEPEPEKPIEYEDEETEQLMQEKQEIIKEREEKKKKRIPGQRLLKKLYRKQQLEDSLVRVVKNLQI